jgi:uncharacterized membrane protein
MYVLNNLGLFLLVLMAFVIFDYIFLGKVVASFYNKEFGSLARRKKNKLKPKVWAATAAYIILALGLLLFVFPMVKGQSALTSIFWGGAFGFVVYSTYDLTNYAVIKKWSLKLTVVDIIWGTVLCGILALLLYLIVG